MGKSIFGKKKVSVWEADEESEPTDSWESTGQSESTDSWELAESDDQSDEWETDDGKSNKSIFRKKKVGVWDPSTDDDPLYVPAPLPVSDPWSTDDDPDEGETKWQKKRKKQKRMMIGIPLAACFAIAVALVSNGSSQSGSTQVQSAATAAVTSSTSAGKTTAEEATNQSTQNPTPTHTTVYTKEDGEFGTFYPTNQNGTVVAWTGTDMYSSQKVGIKKLPLEGYKCGSSDGMYLVVDDDGNFFCFDSSGVEFEASGTNDSRQFAGLRAVIEAQGVTVPDDFKISNARPGRMYTESASSHAVYTFRYPNARQSEKSGLFYFRNEGMPSTYSDDGLAICYGSYGSSFLFYGNKEGKFFWATDMYFIYD